MRLNLSLVVLGAVLALGWSDPAVAQVDAGDHVVVASGGWTMFDEASAIQNAANVQVDVNYHLTPNLSIGPSLFVARPTSDGTYFPPAEFAFGDSIDNPNISQDMFALGYGVVAQFAFGAGSISPFVMAGGGGYILYLDAQINDAATTMTGARFEAGAGVRMAVSGALGIQLMARDHVFTGYERDLLYQVNERYISDMAPETDVEPKSTLHNLALSLGFTYTPGER